MLIILLSGASTLRADPKTIVAFGDSLTQGYGLPADAGFVPQMGAWLAAQGASVRMVNAGVSGDTTAGGLARLDWTLAEPADLVIVNLGSNDMLRGLDPNLAYENLKQIMDKLEAKNMSTLLIGHLGPLNYGAEYKADYDGAFKKLAASYEMVFYPFFFQDAYGRRWGNPKPAALFSARRHASQCGGGSGCGVGHGPLCPARPAAIGGAVYTT